MGWVGTTSRPSNGWVSRDEAAAMSDAVADPVEPAAGTAERRRFELEETDFDEVPKKWRRFYRHWKGDGDVLGPNEVICPVCKVPAFKFNEVKRGA